MKRRIKNKVLITLLIILVNIMFTGCVGKKIEKDAVTCEYDEKIGSMVIENNIDKKIYVDYDIILVDKENKILYKNEYNKKVLKGENKLYNNLEDIKPDYIESNRVEKMDIKVKNVYKYNVVKEILIYIVVIVFVIIFIGCL